VLNQAPRDDVWGNGCIAPRIRDLGTSLKLSASRPDRFTTRKNHPLPIG